MSFKPKEEITEITYGAESFVDCANIINSIGLGFDILGVVILFTIDFKMIELDAGDIPLTKSPEKLIKGRYKAYSGLGLIVLGFLLQLISNFL